MSDGYEYDQSDDEDATLAHRRAEDKKCTKPSAWAMERARRCWNDGGDNGIRPLQGPETYTMVRSIAAALDGVWQDRGGEELVKVAKRASNDDCYYDNVHGPRPNCNCLTCHATAALAKAQPAAGGE